MKVQFSVLMSIYFKEEPEFLVECLESILNQTIPPTEIVIVKDGELTNQLNGILSDYASKYKYLKLVEVKENVGLGKALEIGLQHCTNNLIARMDTDDVCKNNRFEKQLLYFENNPTLAIIGTNVAEFDGNINNIHSIKKMPLTNREIKKYSKWRNPFNHPTVMFKKEVINKVSGYKHMPLFEDYYLWLRVLNNGYEGKNINEELVYMRANNDMYKRRGGFYYFKRAWFFRKEIYKLGYNNLFDIFIVISTQLINSLIPSSFRASLYKKLLRN